MNKESNQLWTEESINALGLYKVITKIICSWPLEPRNIYWKIRITFLLLFLITSGFILSEELVDHCGPAGDIVFIFGLFVTAVSAIFKIILLNVHHDNMLWIITNIMTDWQNAKNNNYQKTIMLKYSSLNRVLFYMVLIPLMLYIVKISSERIPYTTTINNVTVLIRTTPFSSECWSYADTRLIIYIIRFICRIIECCIYNIVSGGVDLYFFVIVMHICGQVEILASNFRQLINKKNNIKLNKKEFIIIIKRKKYLLNLINCLQKSFEFLILVVLLVSTIQLNVIAYTVLFYMKENNVKAAIELTCGTFFYVFAELYIYCYIGDKLSSHIDNLYLSIYESCWYNFPLYALKDLVFIMMMKNNREFKLTAGKIYIINLVNFKNIIKTMGSFFSIMRLKVYQ